MTGKLLKIVRRNGDAYLFGNLALFGDLPKFLRYEGHWPQIRLIFTNDHKLASRKVSRRSDGKNFTASVPARSLGLPSVVRKEDSERVWLRTGPLDFIFDFSVLKSEAGREQREAVQAGLDALFVYASLREKYHAKFGRDLDTDIGVTITFHDPNTL